MRTHLNCWLSEDDIEKIHAYSLEILWERGMRVQHPTALQMLEDAGARVDRQTGMVRYPPELVERCVESMPGTIILAGRNPDDNFNIGSNSVPIVRTSSGSEGYIDLRTRVYRLGTAADLKEWSRLADCLENIHICGGHFPCDVPLSTRDVFTVKTLLENTVKPLIVNPYDHETFKAMIEMAIAIRGNKQALKERPLISILTSATAPGNIIGICVDILLLAGEYGVPVEVNTSPIMGATCPVTVAGCVLQNNVEILALIVISQLANPGTPLIHRGITMDMDMSGGAGLMGTMECALAQAASCQLVRTKYKMPVATNGPISDAKIADGQSQIERTILTLLSALSGSHILLAAGFLEAVYTSDPLQAVIDNEILSLLYRIMRGIDINEDTLAKELIKNMTPGGNFLSELHTVQHFKSEHYVPKLFNRDVRYSWTHAGAKDLNQKAQERAIQLLGAYRHQMLENKVQMELDAIYRNVTEKKKGKEH